MNHIRTRRLGFFGLLIGGAATLGIAGPASAQSPRVIQRGACSAKSDFKLKLSQEDQGLQAEYEVDQNVVGARWNVTLKDNGATVFQGSRVTKAPSGSFTVRVAIPNRAGADNLVAQATNPATGEVCGGNVTL